jgi:hypothetical protein
MKAWRLLRQNMELEILEVDNATHQVTKTTSLALRKPMTLGDAMQYMKDNYPAQDEDRALLVNIL